MESPQEVRTLGMRGSGAQLLSQGSQVVKGRQSLEQQKGEGTAGRGHTQAAGCLSHAQLRCLF